MVAMSHKEGAVAYRIKGLTKVYGEGPAAVHALRGVDLEIPAGELIVLLGPSGSGKSTLLNIIGGLVAKQPAVLFCDEPTGALDSVTGRAVLKVLKDVNERLGATVLIVTHAAATAAMADRVIHFADGAIREVIVNKTKLTPEEIEW